MAQFNAMNNRNINIHDINDIIEVIENTDPGTMENIAIDTTYIDRERIEPYVEILEQPASKSLRFRYECEGRSAGSIPGVNSTSENKTFPSIRIVGYKGRAVVVVSCVTKDAPYRPHPHNLVGKEVCRQGICIVEVPPGNMIVSFSNLGIQCVKKKDIEEALRLREKLKVDPFKTGYDHKRHSTNIDLNAVRLCFQVFLEGSQERRFNRPLTPIVSEPIYDKKAMSDLIICELSHFSAPVAGGMRMLLFCEKIAKGDIQVRFFEEIDGQLIWEGYGDFQPNNVHHQTGIAFRTPAYRVHQVDHPVQVYIQLKRPSDGATSDSRPFMMLPLGTDDADSLKRKRQKFNSSSNNIPGSSIFKFVPEREKHSAYRPTNFNITKSESPILPTPVINTGGFSLQPVRSSQSSMQPMSHQEVPPDQKLSSVKYNAYNSFLVQQQYHPNISDVRLFSNVPDQSQLRQPESNLYMLNKLTPENQELQPINNDTEGAACLLDMDNQQFSFDWSSADLANFGANLSLNLSTGLSLSDAIQTDISNNEEGSNTTEHITWIKQELTALNQIYAPNQENNDRGFD